MKNLSENYNEAQYGAMRTAFLTAFPKIFTDIDYSTQIFDKMKELSIKKGFSFLPTHFTNEMAIEIESRHKALNGALSKHISKGCLVIEIAAGLSPRHLQYKDYDYVEIDFKPVIDIKKAIYKSMGYNFNDMLFDADVTDTSRLKEIFSKVLNKKSYKKIIVVNEGLFWYITKENISNMTKQFINSFEKTDWLWITSDCPTIDKNTSEYRNVIANSAKVKRGKTFDDYADFTDLFKQLGLSNKQYKLK